MDTQESTHETSPVRYFITCLCLSHTHPTTTPTHTHTTTTTHTHPPTHTHTHTHTYRNSQNCFYTILCLTDTLIFAEADDSNASISSEEDLETLEYAKTLAFIESVPKKSISQIIKDKKKQTHLTLQWYGFYTHVP